MNKTETTAIIATIKLAYPYCYKDLTEDDRHILYKLWYEQFFEIPYEIMNKAVNAYITDNNRPPAISDIGEQIDHIKRKAYNALDSHNAQLKENSDSEKYGYPTYNVGYLLTEQQLADVKEVLRVCENRQLRISEMLWAKGTKRIGGKK